LHAVQINFLPPPRDLAAAEVFGHWPSLADIPEAAASSGIRVSVIQAATHFEWIRRGGVDYHFTNLSGMTAVADRGHHFASLLNGIKADVLHVHGLGFAEDAFAIAHYLPRLPILIQDHADRPPRWWWRRLQRRRWYAAAAGVAFTAAELAHPFTEARMFRPDTQLFAIPESSSRFLPGDRVQARAETGLYGNPCVVWVGHLNSGKDPLTVLDGIAQAAADLPGLQLWCAFGNAPLLAEVQQRIAQDSRLAGRVHLLGKVSHARIERLMQAADLFVSGSLAESCGYALLEAMACGAVPVVTDIPSFRRLTGDGRIGALWPCGDSARLTAALVKVAWNKPTPAQVRAHFDETLSFAAVGRQWASAYGQLLHRRRSMQ
jgi:glycosyltransferase involved in cell wall biosynthesis